MVTNEMNLKMEVSHRLVVYLMRLGNVLSWKRGRINILSNIIIGGSGRGTEESHNHDIESNRRDESTNLGTTITESTNLGTTITRGIQSIGKYIVDKVFTGLAVTAMQAAAQYLGLPVPLVQAIFSVQQTH